ncbi:porin family protein [bacterium]|nr:porin family protein [bacterium]
MRHIYTLLLALAIVSSTVQAQSPTIDRNQWQIGLTFGEIPILAGSFKPGITVGYHFDEHFYLGVIIQSHDYIQRDQESFNAENTGLGGLLSSKERTGMRAGIEFRYRPVEWSPYVTAGWVYNDIDTEEMRFGNSERMIGENMYPGAIDITQSRPSGHGPTVGIGWQYDFDNRISVNTNLALSFFTAVATPDITVRHDAELREADLASLKQHMRKAYKDNLHNHYHMFNLGIAYRIAE